MTPAGEVRLDLDGAVLHGEWYRAPVAGQTTVVFLHDGLGCTRSLRDWPARVAEALDTGVFAWDRWGYGRSAARDRFPPHFMEEEAARLPRLLAAAGIGDHYLVGHSDGGTIALLHASARPAGLRAVVSVAAHVRLDPRTRAAIEEHEARRLRGEVPASLRRFHGERAAHVLECWTSLVRDPVYRDWDITPALASVACPVLAVQGEHDAFGMAEQLDWIAAAIPHASVRLLTGLGHFPHVEAPSELSAMVATFLQPYLTDC